MSKYKYLFGPVPSRRLGLSLGVDIVPRKLCTLNCVYCEIGETTNFNPDPSDYYRKTAILDELRVFLADKPELDFITFSGGGEPTLNRELGSIIAAIKREYPQYKMAVITNGTLFRRPEIRKALLPVDIVMPSLDAVQEKTFQLINRPGRNITAAEHIEGLIQFAEEYQKELWLEIFIVPGINDSEEELTLMKEAVQKIKPTRVQLNSLSRPGVVDWIVSAEKSGMEEIAGFLKPLPVEIIKSFREKHTRDDKKHNLQNKVLLSLLEKEMGWEELSRKLEVNKDVLIPLLQMMMENGMLLKSQKNGEIIYSIRRRGEDSRQ